MIDKKIPLELLIGYIAAPRTSETQKTRTELRNQWKKQDSELSKKGESDLTQRAQTFLGVYGVLWAAVPLMANILAHAVPSPITQHLKDGFEMVNGHIKEVLGSLTPLSRLGVGVYFGFNLYQKYQTQASMPEIILKKSSFFGEQLGSNLSISNVQPLLDQLSPADHLLLEHLVTSESDEKLRLFLMGNLTERRELLNRFPPTFEQRLGHLFRTYHLENKGLETWKVCMNIPKRLVEMAAVPLRLKTSFYQEFLNRLEQRRSYGSTQHSSSTSNGLERSNDFEVSTPLGKPPHQFKSIPST